MSFQDVLQFLLPKQHHFFDIVEKEADLVHEAACMLGRFREHTLSSEEVRVALQSLEHKGDALIHEMEEELSRTFVTPIDREDLHKLATELDAILDRMNFAARACWLYGLLWPTEPMIRMIDILIESTTLLKRSIPWLRKHKYAVFLDAKRTMKLLEKEGDNVFREAVSALFHDQEIHTKDLLREKEVLEALESAVNGCEDVAEFLANLAVKQS